MQVGLGYATDPSQLTDSKPSKKHVSLSQMRRRVRRENARKKSDVSIPSPEKSGMEAELLLENLNPIETETEPEQGVSCVDVINEEAIAVNEAPKEAFDDEAMYMVVDTTEKVDLGEESRNACLVSVEC